MDTPPTPPQPDSTLGQPGVNTDALWQKIVDAIKQIYDPEIPVNIYELGLIYDIDIEPAGNVHIRMTLTSPACPSAQELPVQVRAVVSRLPEVTAVDVDIVWDPPWSPNMMTDAAKLTLGFL